jgi:hypothetical protein
VITHRQPQQRLPKSKLTRWVQTTQLIPLP